MMTVALIEILFISLKVLKLMRSDVKVPFVKGEIEKVN